VRLNKRNPIKGGGFTLIELLVVIAIIGVLMGAVIVAINPTKRLADARDANGKTRVATVASAMESCYTVNVGSFASCDTMAKLVPDYVRVDPGGIGFYGCTATKCCLYYDLENGDYWAYESAYGKAQSRTAVTTCP
jgi:prepilin-type N-terminal cleavage/methylation domain-containing protein